MMPAPPQVAEILGAVLVQLPVVDHLEVRRPLIEGTLLLAHYHQETVLTALLRQPLPMERWVPCPGSHIPLRTPDQAHLTTTDMSRRMGPSSSAGNKLGLGPTPSLQLLLGMYDLGEPWTGSPSVTFPFSGAGVRSCGFSHVLVIPLGLYPEQPFHSLQRTDLWAPSQVWASSGYTENVITKT